MSRQRVLRTDKTDPLIRYEFDDDSCFGKEFDLTDANCQLCAEQAFCANAKLSKLPPLNVEAPFLSEAKLPEIDRKALADKYVNKPYVFLRGAVKTQGNVIESLADMYAKLLLEEYNCHIVNGVIRKKDGE